MRKNNGITLIALVVTIIVLLILAGVSITMIAGENGIATKAQNSKIQTVHGNVKEIISLAQSEYYTDFQAENIEDDFISYLNSKNNNAINSDGQIDVEKLTGSKQGAGNGSNKKDVYILEKKLNVYYLKYYDANGKEENLLEFESGSVTITDWQEILANATKHPDQTESETIGIDYKGNPVNMDDWEFFEISDGYYSLGINAHGIYPSYTGGIENGQIVGEVPQYIKEENNDEYYPVVVMIASFGNNTELEIGPKIPDTVVYLENTFAGCTKLTGVKEIPDSVMALNNTFYGCTSLVKTPKLPEGVQELQYAFNGCSNLKEVTNLPDSITNLYFAFAYCKTLPAMPELPANVEDLTGTFMDCEMLTVTTKIPETVTSMMSTFYGCSRLKEAPKIPSKVESMRYTFYECYELENVSEIPASVTELYRTFYDCKKLTGTLIIDANPLSYDACFTGTATDSSANLKLTGKSEKLNELLATANGNVSLLSTEN